MQLYMIWNEILKLFLQKILDFLEFYKLLQSFLKNMLMNSPTFYVDAFQNDLYSQGLSEQVFGLCTLYICYILEHHILCHFCVNLWTNTICKQCILVPFNVWCLVAMFHSYSIVMILSTDVIRPGRFCRTGSRLWHTLSDF